MSPIYSQMAEKNIYICVCMHLHVCVLWMHVCKERENTIKQMAPNITQGEGG